MAFDFGAALSSLGQVAPAMSEGAEIRRQRAADAAAVAQQAQGASDTHEQRQAQTAREQQLTAQEKQNAGRLTAISSKPERGSDGKYYMLFMSPDNKIQRLPVEGDYNPNAEKLATLQQLGIDPKSELGKQYLLNLKPEPFGTTVDMDPQSPTYGKLVYYSKRPQSDDGTGTPPASPGAVPGPSGRAIGGRMPAALTPSTSTRTFNHWLQDPTGKWYKVADSSTTTRGPSQQPPIGAPLRGGGRYVPPTTTTQPTGQSAPPNASPFPGAKLVGQGKLPAAQTTALTQIQPVLTETDRLLNRITELGLQNNNTPGYLAASRLKYAMGIAAPEGELGANIADLSLGSLVEATSALRGSSRSLPALKIALEHTPNAWRDSPKMMYEKLSNIKRRLQDVVNEAKSGGAGDDPKSTINNFVQTNKPQNDPLGIR